MEDEFDVPEDFEMSEDFDNDYLLEQQELADFAQDGYFENMEPTGEGTWQ